MDNDLMARRLRPPSEPLRPTNGHSPHSMDTLELPQTMQPRESSQPMEPPEWPQPMEASQPPRATEPMQPPQPSEVIRLPAPQSAQPPHADDVAEQAPWSPSPETDLRADVPWDRPEPEAWPPVEDRRARLAPATPRPPAPDYEEPDQSQPVAPVSANGVDSNGVSSLGRARSMGRARSLGRARRSCVEHRPWTTRPPQRWRSQPQATVVEPPEMATDVSVAGRPAWDRPDSFDWDEPSQMDDRPPELLADYDDDAAGR